MRGTAWKWSRRVGLNHRPTVYETVALPLSYAGSEKGTPLFEAIRPEGHGISWDGPCQLSAFTFRDTSPFYFRFSAASMIDGIFSFALPSTDVFARFLRPVVSCIKSHALVC